MANALEILIAINGELTDTTVENDSATWDTKVGRVRMRGGGGSWWRPTQPHVCQIDMDIAANHAWLVRTVTIAVKANTAMATPPTGTIDDEYRIVFHGEVQQSKGSPHVNAGPVQLDAVDEMSGLMNRRARTAAVNNSGIRALLTDIETAHGLTMNGGTAFPSSADFPNLDRPKQKGQSNGAWLRLATAGTGINVTSEWDTSITAPDLRWRPDWFDFDYSASVDINRLWYWNAGHPWLLEYDDVGIRYADYVATVNIDGEDSAGAEYYGYARLATAATRKALGNREVNITSWMDTAADCQKHARRLLAHVGDPIHARMYRLTVRPEKVHEAMTADAIFDADTILENAFRAGALLPGDQISARDPFGDTNLDFGDWPSGSSALQTRLSTLWFPEMKDGSGVGTTADGLHNIRTVEREWTPDGGWICTYGVEPVSPLTGSDIVTYGSGTY